eukprot:1185854-Prorocentrum_minimum.AAC.3
MDTSAFPYAMPRAPPAARPCPLSVTRSPTRRGRALPDPPHRPLCVTRTDLERVAGDEATDDGLPIDEWVQEVINNSYRINYEPSPSDPPSEHTDYTQGKQTESRFRTREECTQWQSGSTVTWLHAC